ncbi:hypothetical protein FQN50_001559 [Emmonsiellopsis sp. PD_5]|nr:hypothetical protein FQN50_001559 [Emmonsiellopsis sp. PD_5]
MSAPPNSPAGLSPPSPTEQDAIQPQQDAGADTDATLFPLSRFRFIPSATSTSTDPDIPSGFLYNFRANYRQIDRFGVQPGPDAIRYYEEELTRGDYEFDLGQEYGQELRLGLNQLVQCFEYFFVKKTRNREGEKKEEEDDDDEEEPDEFEKTLTEGHGMEPVSEDNQWIYECRLGGGGFGSVRLWRWFPEGKTEHSFLFAVKDFENDRFWDDYCAEGHLTRRLNAVGCPNVVKVYHWEDMGQEETPDGLRMERFFRILYDYYPGGGVDHLYSYYLYHGLMLPEAFIWHMFHNIATALLYCAHGHTGPQLKPGWEEIIHKDVKPGNVLLGPEPSQDSAEIYPTCYLADFGMAYTIPNDDVRAWKKTFDMEGTIDYLPPEAADVDASGVIGPKVDIYALTLTIREAVESMLNIYTATEIRTLRSLPNNEGNKYLPYSLDLINLCRAAGSSRHAKRPDIYSLWKETGEQAAKWKARVLVNKRAAEEGGRECYEGMVLLADGVVGERFDCDKEFREVFKRETEWRGKNGGLVRFAKELARCIHDEECGGEEEGGDPRMGKGEREKAEVGVRRRVVASEGAKPKKIAPPWEWVKGFKW